MFRILLLLCLGHVSFASASMWLESEQMYPVEAAFEQGRLRSTTQDPAQLQAQIRRQLHYTIGQLNAQLSAPALALSLKSNVHSIEKTAEGLFDVQYTAELILGWHKDKALPASLMLFLPQQSDPQAIESFHAHYVDTCGLPFEEGPETFFFYFRPYRKGCPIPLEAEPAHIFQTEAHFNEISLNGPHTEPNYRQTWRDRKLSVTAYFSETEEGFPSGGKEFAELLFQEYGQPIRQRSVETSNHIITRMLFSTSAGNLDVSIFDLIVGDITTVDLKFARRLSRRIRHSDFVAYNGHAGYGKKIRRFTQLRGFRRGKYKLVYLNGCDTFSYLDHTLFGRRPEIEAITTGLSGFFSHMPLYTLELIRSLMGRKDSYAEILTRISVGVPVLIGYR